MHAGISFIIPVLNDAQALGKLLPQLQHHREQGHEIIIVDGGSADGSLTVARAHADRVLMTGTGRGRQMNLGAEHARHDILVFLHADSLFPASGADSIIDALGDPDCHWGRFNVRLDQPGPVYSLIGNMMNLRSRLSGVATGDQGIFVRKTAFHAAGGYQVIPLMEDVALSKELRAHSRPACLPDILVTSGRRWRDRGVIRTVLLMWYLRLAYACGADAARLARYYYPDVPANRD